MEKSTAGDKNYTVMMVAETDFYIANPSTQDNQIEYNDRLSDITEKRQFDNPVYQKEESADTTSASSTKSTSSDSFYSSDYKYGWLCFQRNALQLLNRPLFFLICLVGSAVAQGLIVTGISFTILTSIEREFGFKSTTVGSFGTFYDAAYGICCVFVGYIGHRHKPRWLGLGLILMAIAAVILSVPKYVIGTYTAGQKRDTDYCTIPTGNNTRTNETCTESSDWYYMFIFVLGNVLMGIGATPLYTLGPAHLNEITERGQGSLYLGIYYAGAAVGPALGFILGLPILNTWTDITQKNDPPLKPTDSNWVGAWWIGYLVGAVFLLIPVIPMLGFPPLFPNTHTVREKKREFEDTIEENKDLKHDLKSVWPATLALLKNPTYLFLCLAISSESLAIGGFSTFIPKFVETQFHFPASSSGLYTGLIVIPGAAGGIFLGGYLSSRFDWNCKQTLKAAAIMAFIATICVSTTLVGCDSRVIVGSNDVRYPLSNSSGEVQLTSTCNSMCQCDTRYYKPVCNEVDGKTFFSPCHAGCLENSSIDNKFYNCSCVSPEVPYLLHGGCSPECTLFPLFVVGAFLMMFFTFMNNVPMINATFRVVPEGQGSFAMGFQQVFVRFLGFVPAPIMFGKLIDESCNLWGTDKCTYDTTSCLEYGNEKFRYYLFMLGVLTKALSFVFIFLAYKVYKLPTMNSEKKNNRETVTNHNEYNMTEIKAKENVITSANTTTELPSMV